MKKGHIQLGATLCYPSPLHSLFRCPDSRQPGVLHSSHGVAICTTSHTASTAHVSLVSVHSHPPRDHQALTENKPAAKTWTPDQGHIISSFNPQTKQLVISKTLRADNMKRTTACCALNLPTARVLIHSDSSQQGQVTHSPHCLRLGPFRLERARIGFLQKPCRGGFRWRDVMSCVSWHIVVLAVFCRGGRVSVAESICSHDNRRNGSTASHWNNPCVEGDSSFQGCCRI